MKCHVIIIIFQVETVKSEQMEEDVLVLLPVADFVNFVQNHKKVINSNLHVITVLYSKKKGKLYSNKIFF